MSSATTPTPPWPPPFGVAFPRPSWLLDVVGESTGRGVRVGVIDSGWDRTRMHPQVLSGLSFVNPDDDLELKRTPDDHDRIGHGTACSELVLRVAPGVGIVPIRVFGGRLETSPATLQAGIRWAVEQELDVVNLSLGTFRHDALRPLYSACEYARRNGIIIVAAMHATRPYSYPAIFENVIGVGAALGDAVGLHVTYHPDAVIECRATAAHEVLWLGMSRSLVTGTSFATPLVSGVVALLREHSPGAGLDDIRFALKHICPT